MLLDGDHFYEMENTAINKVSRVSLLKNFWEFILYSRVCCESPREGRIRECNIFFMYFTKKNISKASIFSYTIYSIWNEYHIKLNVLIISGS